MITSYALTCTCGWSHDTTTRKSATDWKQWHRKQYTAKQQRVSDCGHVVTVTKVTKKE